MAKRQIPVNARLTVKGIPELVETLSKLGVDVEESIAAAALASAFVVSNQAKVSVRRITGNLARSITPGVGDEPRGGPGPVKNTRGPLPKQTLGSVADKLKKDGKETVWVATNVIYAESIEFIEPYMRPALDENGDKVNSTFTKALQQIVAKNTKAA